ncbi:META domain-containing protein [Rubrivirga sp. S365]|uniref:META domain-containing protein n=1 Tax=Rubrivirga sp. S365 TaxID=3076080 RepID=UPI0028C7DC81|nr:META domain-containing protein [Rubrivirga sp. S365]MDT7856743.1 META domain-containing protein [Rubrivirga sp. S365]
MRLLVSLLLLGLFAAGCASTGAMGDAADRVVGPTWQLTSVGTVAAAGPEATITFEPDGRVFGTTGCNRFFGTYDLGSNGALTLSEVGSTRMACPPIDMTQEAGFLDALDRAERVLVEGDQLSLVADDERLLRFRSTAGSTANATLSGTVTYLPRIALPPDAVVAVRLIDVNRGDAQAQAVAENRVETDGGQVPIPFSLRYDASQIQPSNRYVVRAEIYDADGTALWTTDTSYPVLTNGAPSDDVEIRVAQVTETGVNSALIGPSWRLLEIQKPGGVALSYEGTAPFTISFGTDSRYSGQADCNRYGGTFEVDPDGALRLSQGLSTLAACPEPSVSGDFFEVLNNVGRYDVGGGRLTLRGVDGGSLVFQ